MALRKRKRAELMRRYHWTPDQIGGLTDVQIDEYALYPRDEKDGDRLAPLSLKRASPATLTEEEHVRRFLAQARVFGITDPAKVAAKVAEIRAHHARKREQSSADRPEGGGAAPG